MAKEWKQIDLEEYIKNEIEESLTLDYKAGPSLDKSSDEKKMEVTKDVAAMANSAGGLIIYGIQEYNDKPRKHLPEKFSPIDRTKISKEWLEQVINGIRPKIDGVIITPVRLDTGLNDVAYVVEIPQSFTAHQSKDRRYYKRYNFESVAMEDHEVRDVMNRNNHPKIVPDFKIIFDKRKGTKSTLPPELIIYGINEGSVYAQYVVVEVRIPTALVYESRLRYREIRIGEDGSPYIAFACQNTVRDLIERKGVGIIPDDIYGPARYQPILPSLVSRLDSQILTTKLDLLVHGEVALEWIVYADSALPLHGSTKLSEIPIVEM